MAEQKLLNKLRSKGLGSIAAVGLVSLLNLSSFTSVGIQKAVGTEPTIAAVRSELSYGREHSPTQIIYGLGLRAGHKVFYGQENYHEIAKDYLDNNAGGKK